MASRRSKKRKPTEPEQLKKAFQVVSHAGLSGSEEQQALKRKVLEAFARGLLTVTEACEHASVTRAAYYVWRTDDPAFAKALKDIPEIINERLEKTALEIALQERDGKMIRFLLKTRMPEKYGDKLALFGEVYHHIEQVEIIKERGYDADGDARIIKDPGTSIALAEVPF